MHLRFSFNSNNLNAQVNKLHNLKNRITHRGLPSVVSIESVGFGSSESKFGTLVNSTILAWASEMSPSSSWMSLYAPSASEVVSI